MLYDFIFTFLMMIFDGLISIIFDNDYALLTPIFVPGLTTCAFMLCAREMEYKKAFEFSAVIGLVLAIFEPNSIWVFAICFIVVNIAIKSWSISISDSFFEQLLLCLLSIFIKEFIVYLFALMYGDTNISLISWVYKVLFKTMLFNIPLSILVIVLNRQKIEIVGSLEKRKKKKEKVFWGD